MFTQDYRPAPHLLRQVVGGNEPLRHGLERVVSVSPLDQLHAPKAAVAQRLHDGQVGQLQLLRGSWHVRLGSKRARESTRGRCM